jgi:hypothetical protein
LLANRSPDPVRSWSANPPRWVRLETVGSDALTAVAAAVRHIANDFATAQELRAAVASLWFAPIWNFCEPSGVACILDGEE